MDRPVLLALIGFLIGGAITLYVEWKSSAAGTPQSAAGAPEPAVDTPAAAPQSPVVKKSPPQRQKRRPPRHENKALEQATAFLKQGITELAAAKLAADKERAAARALAKPKPKPRPAPIPPVASAAPVAPVVTKPPADTGPWAEVRVTRLLVGVDPVTLGLVSESVADTQAKRGKYLVYLALCVTNTASYTRHRADLQDFKLEDNAGLLCDALPTTDALSADIRPGKTACGGVAFAVYGDGAPARLLHKSGPEDFTPLPASLFTQGPTDGAAEHPNR